MRIGTFLMGSIVGAAAVVYFSDKKNRTMMMNAVASPKNALGNMFNNSASKAAGAIMNAMNMGANTGKTQTGANAAGSVSGMASAPGTSGSAWNNGLASQSQSGSSVHTGSTMAKPAGASTSAASTKDGMAQVEKIVNEDPKLKRTVNEILTESGKTGAQLQ